MTRRAFDRGRLGRSLIAWWVLIVLLSGCSSAPAGSFPPSPGASLSSSVASLAPTLGNHSYTHRDFRTLSASEIRNELQRAEDALARYCSQDPRPLFRPPNGGYDADVLAALGSAGYRTTVLWDIDTIDWRPIDNDPPGPTADQIVAKVLGNAQGGSIVLMHLGGYQTHKALTRIVAGLDDAGYELVTLDELLGT